LVLFFDNIALGSIFINLYNSFYPPPRV